MVKFLPSPQFVILLLISFPCRHSALDPSPVSSRFRRLDPLHGFRLYKGSYNVKNKHYWGSAAFTGVHGFAMAGFWTLGGLILLGYSQHWKNNGAGSLALNAEKSHGCCRLLPFFAIILLTLLVLVLSGIALAAMYGFHKRARMLEKVLLGAVKASLHAMRRVIYALRVMQRLLCDRDQTSCALLGSVLLKLRTESQAIHAVVHKDGNLVNYLLRSLQCVTFAIIGCTALLIIVKIVAILMKWRTGCIT